jgi:dihydropteroate synthase
VKVLPVPVRAHRAVQDALLSHGWEGDLASVTEGGLAPAAFHVTELPPQTIEAMVPLAARLGLELVTGDDWILLAGPRSRLGAFARPWVQPEPVRALAEAIGMAMPADGPPPWRHAAGSIALDRPVIVGIINVTPDSFSPASRVGATEEAVALAHRLVGGGATVLDVGGESTRPGAASVRPPEESGRVVPVIEALHASFPEVTLSVDTMHAGTARAALAAGAGIVNDVTAGRHDPPLLGVVAEHGAGVVLSHSRGAAGTLADLSHLAEEADVVSVVCRELLGARDAALAAGIAPECIALDPGFGFGKSPEQNLRLLDALDAVVSLGHPVMVGMSRKRFLGAFSGRDLDDRDRATAAACAIAADRGAHLFRVHDAHAVRDALAVAGALPG